MEHRACQDYHSECILCLILQKNHFLVFTLSLFVSFHDNNYGINILLSGSFIVHTLVKVYDVFIINEETMKSFVLQGVSFKTEL